MSLNKNWTIDRVKEFEELKRLIWDIQSLDRGSNFIEKVTKCIETANKLERTDFSIPRLSFIDFLRDLMVDARLPKAETPEVPNAPSPH